MRESSLDSRQREYLRLRLPGAVVRKYNDRTTIGIPDSSVTWYHADSWIEFKVLKIGESIHGAFEPGQLPELIKIAHQTHRAWVLAWRAPLKRKKFLGETVIWDPIRLMAGKEPLPASYRGYDEVLRELQVHGVYACEGVDFRPLLYLIHKTHGVTL